MRIIAKNSGFGLIETLIVLAISGIIITLFSFNLQKSTRSIENRKIEKLANSAIRSARATAIQTGQQTSLSFDLSSNSILFSFNKRSVRLPVDLNMSIVSAQEAAGPSQISIVFMPDGTSSGGRIVFQRHGWERQIFVDWSHRNE